MSRRFVVVVWALPWVVAAACGGRTGQDLPGFDGGAGGPNGAGGNTNGGVFVGMGGGIPKPGTGGRKVGPALPAGGTIGLGGSTANAAVANATFVGGFGGFGAGGAPSGCTQPTCMCGDCYSQCTCKLGALGSVALCKNMCFGAGGSASTGGVTGAGGTVACVEDAGVAIACPTPTLLVPTCCTAGRCGLLIDLAGAPQIPLESGCLPYAQPGLVDARCPDLGELLGTQAGSVPGCCRSDGTCGIVLDMLDLGCVQTRMNGASFRCDRREIVDAGRD